MANGKKTTSSSKLTPRQLFRESLQEATTVFESLIPNQVERRVCCELLVNAIEYAHEISPNSWGITLYSNLVRLNVGMVEVAVVTFNNVYLILDGSVIPASIRERFIDYMEVSSRV